MKAARSRFPIVISRSSASSMAVAMAKQSNIDVVTYVRGGRFNYFDHGARTIRIRELIEAISPISSVNCIALIRFNTDCWSAVSMDVFRTPRKIESLSSLLSSLEPHGPACSLAGATAGLTSRHQERACWSPQWHDSAVPARCQSYRRIGRSVRLTGHHRRSNIAPSIIQV